MQNVCINECMLTRERCECRREGEGEKEREREEESEREVGKGEKERENTILMVCLRGYVNNTVCLNL